ncbi:sensor histidine kinase [Paraburkholderia rhizosphaerae]|nr:ATP-binding protein [Paraburkholderia rhizosphaerae]
MAGMRHGVGMRLLIGVLIFSSAITLIMTAVQLYLDYRYDVGLIEHRLNEIGEGYPDIIGESLWHLDREQVRIEVESILKLPDIQAVTVRETGTGHPLVIMARRRQSTPVLTRELPINRVVEGKLKQIGTLYIEAALTDVYRRLMGEALVILVSQGAKTFLVSLFILFIFSRLVTRHLATIAQFMRTYDFHRPAAALALKRRQPAAPDELDQVVMSFNDLCTSLQLAYRNQQAANDALEQDVAMRIRKEEALREAEQRYRHLFHDMPIALIQMHGNFDLFPALREAGVTDLNAYFDANPDVLRRLTSAIAIDEVNARSVELFRAGDAAQLVGPAGRLWTESPGTLRRAFESRYHGETRFNEEMKVATLDGRVIDVLCAISRPQPIGSHTPTLMGLIDITERVRVREKLQQLETDLAHAGRISLLGELMASIAHEINQPLGAVAASAQAIQNWLNRPEPPLDEVRELTALTLASARRASDIIVRTRAMAAKGTPRRDPLYLDDVIDEALLLLSHEIHAKGVELLHRPAPAAPRIMADRTQLQQVVVNLTINAMQAVAPLGTGHGKVALTVIVPSPGMVGCVIEDNGPGIREESLALLFDRFFTTSEGGMGMGLAICRTIIEAHGGRIAADNASTLGGARFTFTLPAGTS